MTNAVIKRTFRPYVGVGQVYARPYGSTVLPAPIGNVLELVLSHKETVIKQPDMTRTGGGTYSEVRRVEEANVAMKLADFNAVNLARASYGTVEAIEAGTVAALDVLASRGGLIRTFLSPTAVTLKKVTPAVDPEDPPTLTDILASNYEVRPEGIYLLESATGFADGDTVRVAYSYGVQAAIQALTTSTPELELSFGGLNEGDNGRPMVVDIFRCSQSIAQNLALIGQQHGTLDVGGTIMVDPTKSGSGISRFYKVGMT